MTPGQALYEALERSDSVAWRPWSQLDRFARQAYEDAAQAAIAAQQPPAGSPESILKAVFDDNPLANVPPGELLHLLSLIDLTDAGKAAYDGYRSVAGNRSLVSGQTLPEWAGQAEPLRKSWTGSADMVIALVVEKLTEAVAAHQPQPAPADIDAAFASGMRVRTARCTAGTHDGEHFQVRTNGHWVCGHLLAALLIDQVAIADETGES